MLLSRFWYVILAVAAAAGTAAALLAQSVINARSDEALADNLARDRVVVEAMLRLEARSRLDRIAFITVDSKLGGLLRAARDIDDEKKLREISGQVRDILRGHVQRIVEAAGDAGGAADKRGELEPDIAFALDGNGRIIAQLGPLEANPPGASLATFPLIKRALQGYVRDDVLMYDRRIYRMAARPVMSGSEYGGVIVHGYRLEKGLTEKLAKNLGGATLAFFQGNDVLGVHIPEVAGAPQQAELASVLPKLLSGNALASGGTKELTELQNGGRATFMLVAGAAAANNVGYAIARPRKLVMSPEELFQQASQDDVKSLPLPLLVGGAVLLALIGLLSIYIERDRHMKQLLTKTGEIGGGTRDRLVIGEWSGAYRKLADKINQAIDKEVEKAAERAPSLRKKANLDELLGQNPEANVTPFFGFANEGGGGRGEGASPVSPAPAAPAKPAAVAAAPAKPAPAIAAVPAAVAAPAAAAAAAAPAIPAARARAPQGPPPAIPVAAAPAPAPAPTPPVRAASQPLAMPSIAPAAMAHAGGGDNGADFDEVAHHKEVYQQYLETRRKCGEPVDNLTFDKFGVTLRKTRDQILQKHDARAVRFTVQVKEGKAALKAQPIKR